MIKFSIIIPSVNGLPTIADCLNSIIKQQGNFNFEIIVVDRTKNDTDVYIRKNFPEIKLVKVADTCGIPEMRSIAMDLSAGEFLVFTEDHCIVPENWLMIISEAHSLDYQVVGGAVNNKCRKHIIDRAVFLCEYSSFMPPLPTGETEFLTGNNTSYHRSTIFSLDNILIKNNWEYFLQAELKQKNVKFFSVSSLIIDHKKEFGFFYFLAQRFHYSRSFAAMRREKISFTTQVFYLFYLPFLPVHQIWKIYQNVYTKNQSAGDFFLTFPYLIIFMASYTAGELTGYLFGGGNSLSKVE